MDGTVDTSPAQQRRVGGVDDFKLAYRIRHADGITTPLWTNGKDTRAGNFKPNELFKDLKIRAVSVAEVGK